MGLEWRYVTGWMKDNNYLPTKVVNIFADQPVHLRSIFTEFLRRNSETSECLILLSLSIQQFHHLYFTDKAGNKKTSYCSH